MERREGRGRSEGGAREERGRSEGGREGGLRTTADHRNPQPSIHSSLSREERACHSHWKEKATPLQTVHVHHLRTRWPLYLIHSRSAVPSSVQTAFQGLYSTPDNQTEYNDGARNSCGSRHQRNFPTESRFFRYRITVDMRLVNSHFYAARARRCSEALQPRVI